MLKALCKGVLVDGKLAAFESVTPKKQNKGSNQWYQVILKEGRQREVRKLWATQGVTVSRLIRVRFGPIVLPTSMKPGQSIFLAQEKIEQIKHCVGL
jgi:23S rRNA pseudouridine2605 synthase